MIGEQKGAAWTDLVNKGQLTAAIDQLQPAEKLPDGVNQDSLAFRLLMEQKHVATTDAAHMAAKERQYKKERKCKKMKKRAELLDAFMKQSEHANRKCMKMVSLFAQQGQRGIRMA